VLIDVPKRSGDWTAAPRKGNRCIPPSSVLVETTFRPIFLPRVPEMRLRLWCRRGGPSSRQLSDGVGTSERASSASQRLDSSPEIRPGNSTRFASNTKCLPDNNSIRFRCSTRKRGTATIGTPKVDSFHETADQNVCRERLGTVRRRRVDALLSHRASAYGLEGINSKRAISCY